MKLVTSLVLLVAIGVVYPKCLTISDGSQSPTSNPDLSGVTDFGLDLYKKLARDIPSENLFLSPYSIWTALIMAYFGSAGNTQRQLETALRVSDKASTLKVWRDLQQLYEERQQGDVQYAFSIASRAYFRDNVPLNPCMTNVLRNELRSINSSDINASTKEINSFVNETTRGRISTIVEPDVVQKAIMILVNAAYFKGTWKIPFDPALTLQKDFIITPQTSAPVDMMTHLGNFRYGESSQLGARLLELPYAGDDISMFLLLPKITEDFPKMIDSLDGGALREAIHSRNMR